MVGIPSNPMSTLTNAYNNFMFANASTNDPTMTSLTIGLANLTQAIVSVESRLQAIENAVIKGSTTPTGQTWNPKVAGRGAWV